MGLIFSTIQQRHGTSAEWAAADPVLAQGEEGLETDTRNKKIGDGLTHWNDLDYFPTINSSEWVLPTISGLAYISATQFSIIGDQSAIFPVGIRVKAVCSSGTIYGSVSDSSAGGLPEITMVSVQWDSGSLDSGLSSIKVGIFSPENPSVPEMYFANVGEVKAYAGDTAPIGWLLCDGQDVSRTTYARLFAICGVKFGAGDNVNTFNLPDLRGRFIIGPDNMGGGAAGRVEAAVAPGENGGIEALDLSHVHDTGDHALSIDEIPSHDHNGAVHDNLYAGDNGATMWGYSRNTPTAKTSSVGGGGVHNHGATEESGSEAQSIMNPWLAMNYIIRC